MGRAGDQGVLREVIMILCQTVVCLALAITGALEQIQPPPIEEMPLSLTNYWFFDSDGNPVPYGGQANGDPYHYANTEPTSADHAGKVAACIQEWTTFGWTTAVTFMWYGEQMTVACYDNFGAESYRQPFYHEGYSEWVVPIDLLSPVPYHGLVREWATDMVRVGNLQ